MSENIFADEWMECLEAHYMHVIRIKDKVTEPSLSIVMHSAGFSDAQLAELRVRATMHVDDVGTDFVPDLDVLDAHDHHHQETAPEAVETHVYNIPIDIAPTPIEIASPVETELSSSSDTMPEVEVELESELIDEEALAETELSVESASLPEIEAELEPEALNEEEAVEQESEPEDPDAPQQLSLF